MTKPEDVEYEEIATDVTNTLQENEGKPEVSQEDMDKFMRGWLIHKFRYHITEVFKYMENKNKSIDDIRKEIEEKKCKLSAAQRDFIMSFKTELLESLLKDLYTPQALTHIKFVEHEADQTVVGDMGAN